MTQRPLVGCPDCGTIQRLPDLQGRGSARCVACERVLERTRGRSIDAALTCAIATFLLLFPANLLPLLKISILGVSRQSVLASGAFYMWGQGWPLLGAIVLLQGVVLPFGRFGLLTATLGALRLGRHPRWLGPCFRMAEGLDLWAMPEVYLIGCAVGYGRVANRLPLVIGAGGWCFIAAALLAMVSRAAIDRREVWDRIAPVASVGLASGTGAALACTTCEAVVAGAREQAPCPRCGAALFRRKPFAVMRAAALVATGALLYPVANLFAMSAQIELGQRIPHTIFDGVLELLNAGFWPLAALIFTTSITIPVLKLLGLTWCMLTVRWGSRRGLVLRTRLFRLIHEIGRWSNVDVFTIAVFLPLMQFHPFLYVTANAGALPFLMVIVLTMIAAHVFDPRLMWDAARAAA